MNPMKEFITAVQTDAAFDEEIHALLQDGRITELLEAAARKGFIITETDLRAHIDGKFTKEELSEEALEGIAGGSGDGTFSSPYISDGCWFIEEKRVERNLCSRLVCKKGVLAIGKEAWYQCHCWGTSRCRDKEHHVNYACR